jgi:hypothetical protein
MGITCLTQALREDPNNSNRNGALARDMRVWYVCRSNLHMISYQTMEEHHYSSLIYVGVKI